MTEGDGKPKSRKRNYAPKVRTGCKTCKIRRVKCDEGKPSCQRCTSTGRTCDGYATTTDDPQSLKQEPQEQQLAVLKMKTVSFFPNTVQDGYTIDMFTRRTAPRISGFYDEPFWSRIVVQLSYSEPAICNALVAVTRVYEEMESRQGGAVPDIDSVALQSYTKAIRHVVNEGRGSQNKAYVSLVVCALFVCLESLRGNSDAAATHVQGGYNILADWKREKSPSSSRSGSPSSPDSISTTSTSSEKDLMEELSTVFSHLRIQNHIFGKPLSKEVLEPPSNDPHPAYNFASVSEAREANFKIMNEAVLLVYLAAPLKYQSTITPEMRQLQTKLTAQFQAWRHSLDEFLKENEMNLGPEAIKAANLVKTQQLSGYIWTSCCLAPEESQYDRFSQEFEEINTLAATITDISPDYLCNTLGRFQFNIGILPALHFTGSKCRWPLIRKETLRILSKHRWREGLFDSWRSYRYVKKVMELEERTTAKLLGLSSSELDHFIPPEAARVHFGDMGQLIEGTEFQNYSFYTKPDGVFGEWYIEQKLLSVSPGDPNLDWVEDLDLELGEGPRAIPLEREHEVWSSNATSKRMT